MDKQDKWWMACVHGGCKAWLMENPIVNNALLLWLLCVGVSGGMLGLLLLGLLDGAFFPAERNRWIEINNQVLNALFTLMSIYQHPQLCHHLFLLCRWCPPHDIADLRAAYYSKQEGSAAAGPLPGERVHIGVVVALLHLTVACQYVLCGLYWGYTRSTRPEVIENGFFVLGVVAPVAAAVYTACSPLGRPDQCELVSLTSGDAMAEPVSVKQEGGPETTPMEHVLVIEPEWAGGMFDCDDNPRNLCLSASCTFCVFGWNMERLGLGNRYVHAITFALLCFAPLCVFGISALHIHDYVIGDVVGGAGVLLCACGLLYGGHWRIQMRRRFRLPPTGISWACFGDSNESLADYARWLLCWPCALAQEIRTASLYHIDGENFFHRKVVVADDGHEERQPLLKSSHHHYDDVPSAPDTLVVAVPSPQLAVAHDDEAMVPQFHQAVVLVQVEDHDECSVVPHGQNQMTNNSSSVAVIRDENDESLVEEDAHQLPNESWRVDKLKKLINMVTLLSLLILLYTRGFIR